jgi:O-antigen/teichoic acid export membrane protein
MSAEKAEKILTIDHKPHAAFFRQSGWMMLAAVVGGAMSYLVHFLNKFINADEYTAFGVLLAMVSVLPMTPVQMMFTQQSALTLATGRERQLSRLIRMVWLGITVFWLVLVLGAFVFQKQIVAGWHLPNSLSLWITVVVVLFYMWLPLFSGVLQGRQDFFYLGWSSIFGGFGRLALAAILVLGFGWGAKGMMAGVLFGYVGGVVIAVWRTRDLWTLPTEKFDMRSLVQQVTPLLFGFGACQVLFTSDTLFAKAYFSDDAMKPYVMAGTLSRALLWLVMPLAAVMFPKLVQSRVKSEKNNLFGLVVLGTAILSVCGALGLWLVGPLVVRILASPGDVPATMALIPWYAGAMVPLAMANVMVNDLLARARFTVVPFIVILALAYGISLPIILNHFPGRLQVVLQTLAVFNLLLFGVCAWFTWGMKNQPEKPKALS